jgi:hypothetical protein
VAGLKKAIESVTAERDDERQRLADADRALSQARAESARRASQNRALLSKLTSSQVPLSIVLRSIGVHKSFLLINYYVLPEQQL